MLLIHWTGGRHTEVRVPRVKTGRYPGEIAPTAVDALRKLAGHWPDRELAVSLNRMRCKTSDGETWTTVRVREMRERLGLPGYDSAKAGGEMVSLAKAAERLGICVGSAKTLAIKGILPATQAMPGAQWLVPAEALTSEAVRIGVRGISPSARRYAPLPEQPPPVNRIGRSRRKTLTEAEEPIADLLSEMIGFVASRTLASWQAYARRAMARGLRNAAASVLAEAVALAVTAAIGRAYYANDAGRLRRDRRHTNSALLRPTLM